MDKNSIRCRVCNTTIQNKTDSKTTWECQNCGNIIDSNGHVVNAS